MIGDDLIVIVEMFCGHPLLALALPANVPNLGSMLGWLPRHLDPSISTVVTVTMHLVPLVSLVPDHRLVVRLLMAPAFLRPLSGLSPCIGVLRIRIGLSPLPGSVVVSVPCFLGSAVRRTSAAAVMGIGIGVGFLSYFGKHSRPCRLRWFTGKAAMGRQNGFGPMVGFRLLTADSQTRRHHASPASLASLLKLVAPFLAVGKLPEGNTLD